MLKISHSEKNTETEAIAKLSELLNSIPTIELLKVDRQSQISNMGVDFIADIVVSGKSHTLICEVKSSGQPRYVQMGLLQPVSYTHLDVYKRQDFNRVPTSYIPVSYTHLDVYKRQDLW